LVALLDGSSVAEQLVDAAFIVFSASGVFVLKSIVECISHLQLVRTVQELNDNPLGGVSLNGAGVLRRLLQGSPAT